MGNKKLYLHLLIVIVFIYYIFNANYIFGRIFTVRGESDVMANTNIKASGLIRFNIETVQEDKVKWKELINISGWGFIWDLPTDKDTEIFLVLTSDKHNYTFTTDLLLRPDINPAFKELKVNLKYSGFSALISKDLLLNDDYKMGLFIKNKTAQELTYGKQILTVEEGSVKIK